MVGQTPLHPNVRMLCGGNRIVDNAIAQKMGTAMQSRLIHFEMGIHAEDWLQWAAAEGIDHRIQAFINCKQSALSNFDPAHTDVTFACPRTWHFLSDIIKDVSVQDLTSIYRPTVEGTIGRGMANEFLGWVKLYGTLPDINQIKRDPDNAPVPARNEKGHMFAMSGILADHMTDEKVTENLIKYAKRLPLEFQVVSIRQAVGRDENLVSYSAMLDWFAENGNHLWGRQAA